MYIIYYNPLAFACSSNCVYVGYLSKKEIPMSFSSRIEVSTCQSELGIEGKIYIYTRILQTNLERIVYVKGAL